MITELTTEEDDTDVRDTDTELLFLARSLVSDPSAVSALSSASSSSCWTLRYLARLMAAISSCKEQ